MTGNRTVGTQYEKQAARYLESKGYRILEQNFRCRQGEIDLIGTDGDALVFIEVKYRRDSKTGEPQEAVNIRKQRKICRVASYYCFRHKIPPERACRFDVLAICGKEFTLIQNAFDYRE